MQMLITSAVRKTMATHKFTDQQVEAVLRSIKGMQQYIRKYKGIDRILFVFGQIDATLEKSMFKEMKNTGEGEATFMVDRNTGYRIRCTKGCSHCCRIPVVVSPEEALVAALYAKGKGIDINEEAFVAQYEIKDNKEQYLALPYESAACIFLDKEAGLCKIYPARPITCRTYFVVTPPELCSTKVAKTNQVLSPSDINVEIIRNALLVARHDPLDHAFLAPMFARACAAESLTDLEIQSFVVGTLEAAANQTDLIVEPAVSRILQ